MNPRDASVDDSSQPANVPLRQRADLEFAPAPVGQQGPLILAPSGDRTRFAAVVVGISLVGALVVVAMAARSAWAAIALGIWAAFGVIAAIVDLRTARLPDRIVLPGLVCSLLLATLTGNLDPGVVGGVLFGVPLFAAHLLRPDGMGFGDVKYAALLGVGLGTIGVPLVLPAYLLASVIHAVICLAAHAGSRPVPFGPALAVGSICTAIVALVRT